MDIPTSQWIRGEHGNIGLLLKMDAVRLAFPADMFDSIVSFSTFEHVHDVPSVTARQNCTCAETGWSSADLL